MRKSKTGFASTVKRYCASEIFWLLLVCISAAGVTVASQTMESAKTVVRAPDPGVLFVGDVMLARRVETLMDAHGTMYPFTGVRDLLARYSVVVGNFEATIPPRHVQTPDLTFQFSVDPRVVPTLARVGFTDMTLANNHALDHGDDAYSHTRTVLSDAGIAVAGHPRRLAADDVLYHTVDGVQVAIIPMNTTFGTPSHNEIQTVLATASAHSDVQIVSIHWGTEYEPVAGNAQRVLAHLLIDEGVDAIIGHHPHVVQGIEAYRGAPIFYSLGNFVFDQYWNADVQQGLAVALSFEGREVHYELIPVSSEGQRSAPTVMSRRERAAFLDALATRSEPELASAIRDARIIEPFAPLASLQ